MEMVQNQLIAIGFDCVGKATYSYDVYLTQYMLYYLNENITLT